MAIDRTTTVTLKELALCLGKSASRVTSMESEGIVVRKSHNNYLLLDSLDKYHEWSRKGGNAKDTRGNVIDYDEQRARKVMEEADRLERLRLKETKDILSKEEYSSILATALNVQKRELAALPLTLQRMVPGMSAKAIEQVTKACARAHNAILDLRDAHEAELNNEQRA